MNRNQVNFKNLYDAKIQALALAKFYNMGRHIVYKKADGTYYVQFDECKVRDGVDESDIIYEACSNCNSGTQDYTTCKKEAIEEINLDY